MRTRGVKVGDIRLAVSEAGEGGRPILLLHGFTGAKEDFSEWLDQFAAAGWHAVAPDHRGHGESDKPTGLDAYSFDILAGDARGLVDALGWDRYVLHGHSMGGFVAQRLAFADPARLTGLVLQDTGHGPIDLDAELAPMAARIALEQGMDVLADLMLEHGSPLDTPAHQRLVKERPGYEDYGYRNLRAVSPWLYSALLRELLSGPDTLGDLSAMDPPPPTLVMVGEQDTPFLDSAKRIAGAVRGATLAVIPDAGHSPQFENPDAWWQVMSAFLDGVS